MGRTMPTECEHGKIIDWGDFGPDDYSGTSECDECEIRWNRKEDAWKRLQNLWEETSETWEVRRDIHVTALGPDRGVELTLWYEIPGAKAPKNRGYQSTGRRNVSTMRELALSIWAACDFVDEVNPEWASLEGHDELDPVESFIMDR